MELLDDACYSALAARDRRFDGVFYVGVLSTGIFCRPICPARTPKRAGCRFFGDAAAASAAGFRPCLRCRPERAPGVAAVDASRSLARRAARRIYEGALDVVSLDGLAQELGCSSRQVRRAMVADLGTTPVALAQGRRLMLAKHLLQDSALDVAQVALASGFGSVRRLNAVFRERFQCAPTDVRRGIARPAGLPLVLRLDARAPYDGERLLRFLAARAIPGVERAVVPGRGVTAGQGGPDVGDLGDGAQPRYERVVHLAGRTGVVRVVLEAPTTLRVELELSLMPVLVPVLARLRALFDLDAQPERVAADLGADPLLGPLVRARPGLRVPGAFDAFEAGVRAILGQQVSVAAATTLAGRFARAFGSPIAPPPELGATTLCLRFPTAEAIAALSPEDVAAIGMPRARAATVVALAQALHSGALRLSGELEPFVEAARALPGVGDWTAHYLALRALHHPDAFPAGDLGVIKALYGASKGPLRETLARAESWRPWRAYAVLHLWTHSAEGGSVPSAPAPETPRPSAAGDA